MQPIVIENVRAEITPLLKESGVDLVELTLWRSGNRPCLRVLVDRVGGITLEEVSNLNREISARLDAVELLTEPYLLEVSSPGLDRPLKTEEDFRRAQGEVVKVVTREPIDGENTYTGKVEEIQPGVVTVQSRERGRVTLSLDGIANARRVIKL